MRRPTPSSSELSSDHFIYHLITYHLFTYHLFTYHLISKSTISCRGKDDVGEGRVNEREFEEMINLRGHSTPKVTISQSTISYLSSHMVVGGWNFSSSSQYFSSRLESLWRQIWVIKLDHYIIIMGMMIYIVGRGMMSKEIS